MYICIFWFVRLTLNLHSEGEVSDSIHWTDNEAVLKFTSRSHYPERLRVWPSFAFCGQYSPWTIYGSNLKFVSSAIPYSYRGGPKNFKSRSLDPCHTRFDLLLHFPGLYVLMVNLCAKFEVSNLTCPRHIDGVPKFKTRSRDRGHTSFVTQI